MKPRQKLGNLSTQLLIRIRQKLSKTRILKYKEFSQRQQNSQFTQNKSQSQRSFKGFITNFQTKKSLNNDIKPNINQKNFENSIKKLKNSNIEQTSTRIAIAFGIEKILSSDGRIRYKKII